MLSTLIHIHGPLSKLRTVKLMFLISRDTECINPLYYFVPYRYGPFSFQLYADLSFLMERGYITEAKNQLRATEKVGEINLNRELKTAIGKYTHNFRNYSDSALINYVYTNYPNYTIYDEVITSEYTESGIVTVGYEGLSIDQFLMKMILNKISLVIDVRKNAFSRKYGFSSNLEGFLKKFHIEYNHYPELGIPSHLRKNLRNSADYRNLFREYEKTLESELILKIIEKIFVTGLSQKIALMCFESDPRYCHRGVVGKKLIEMGAQVIDL